MRAGLKGNPMARGIQNKEHKKVGVMEETFLPFLQLTCEEVRMGKLYIHFTMEFPESLSREQCKALEGVLAHRPSMQMTDMELDEREETTLHDVNIEEEMRMK
ncbi:hypothetical protein Tco_1395491 [Tanacetum coccineum]